MTIEPIGKDQAVASLAGLMLVLIAAATKPIYGLLRHCDPNQTLRGQLEAARRPGSELVSGLCDRPVRNLHVLLPDLFPASHSQIDAGQFSVRFI